MLWFLGEYTVIYLMLAFILVPVVFLRIFNKYAKIIIAAYYIILSIIFITGREAISDKYKATPVPDIYWDKNSKWVEDLSYFFFIPAAALVTYIFYKWFYYGKGIWSRVLSISTFLIVLALFLYFVFMFGFGLGYRP